MRSGWVIGAVLLAAAGAARGEVDGPSFLDTNGLNLSGSARAGYWTSDRNRTNRRNFTPGSVWLKAAPRFGYGVSARAEGWVADQRILAGDRPFAELREAFLSWDSADLDVSVGRRIVAWGRADKVNPTDVISSRDYTLLFAEDDDQRRGNVVTTLSRAFDDLAVTGLWLPEFRPNIYPLPKAVGVHVDEEGERFDPAQFGLRLDRTGKGFDWSLSYFDGIDRDPSFRIRGFDAAGLDVTTVHRRTRVLGGDFATNIGAFGVRGEGAYQIPDSPTPTDAFDRREFISAVLGADRNVTEHFNINVQYVLHHVIDYDDPRKLADPVARSVATSASLLSNQLLRTQHGATLRAAYTALNDTLTIELTAAGFFTDGSTAVRPKLSYALTDSVKVVGGIDLFFGEPDTFFGQLRQNRTAYAELRYGF